MKINNLNRRESLKALVASGALSATCLSNLSFGAQNSSAGSAVGSSLGSNVGSNMGSGALIVVFLRGGADSLHMAAPVDNQHYLSARPPDLRILDNGQTPGIRLPNSFSPKEDCRLHPSAAPLLDLLQSGHAGLLHACGLSYATRSHFEAQELLDAAVNAHLETQNGATAVNGSSQSSTKILSSTPGWLTPYAQKIKPNTHEITTLSTTPTLSRSLQGLPSSLVLGGDLRGSLNLPGDAVGRQVLEAMYGMDNNTNDPAVLMGKNTLTQFALLESKAPKADGRIAPYAPLKDVKYNTENYEWSQATQTVAQLVRMDVGLRVACLDFGGWDTHEYQGGRINNLIRQWSGNIRALFDDLKAADKDATIVVLSEFGRRIRANNSNGTDHGHAGIVWCLDTRKRKLLPDTIWPGMAIEQMDQGLDLASTTDVKKVLNHIALQTV